MKPDELLRRLVAGNTANVAFSDFVKLVEAFGFEFKRQHGSHLMFKHPAVAEVLSIQPLDRQAKPYQLRDFVATIERLKLELTQNE